MESKKTVISEMSDRSREVFTKIVEAYVATGEPIGSRTLSQQLSTSISPATVRNAAAIYTSRDLRTWDFNRVFLYSKDVHHVGFQYLNFLVEGNDLVVVSRTAYNVGIWNTPRAHDSNLMTFHRIRDFRARPANRYAPGSKP